MMAEADSFCWDCRFCSVWSCRVAGSSDLVLEAAAPCCTVLLWVQMWKQREGLIEPDDGSESDGCGKRYQLRKEQLSVEVASVRLRVCGPLNKRLCVQLRAAFRAHTRRPSEAAGLQRPLYRVVVGGSVSLWEEGAAALLQRFGCCSAPIVSSLSLPLLLLRCTFASQVVDADMV